MARRQDRAGTSGAGRFLRFTGLRVLLLGTLSCAPAPEAELVPRSTLFVGVDVSGSFQKGGRYDDAMAFAAHYIHAHLAGAGGLEQPRALFVGAIGGEKPGQPQSFHPVHDFEGKPVEQIEADLREWFRPNDNYTDFTAFFERAATLVKRQNLVMAPVTLVLLTDGIPDVGPGGPPIDEAARYANIDMDALEYLARNITVRVLYPDPTVAVHWERSIPRERVRMWTVDANVMKGWREQLQVADEAMEAAAAVERGIAAAESGGEAGADGALAGDRAGGEVARAGFMPSPRESGEQPDLWRWILDNVDFRVRRSVL
ncbi:MAG: hypothetical protein KY466_00185 [Gemmatimonadetes bacterium]|nr:hypothetical protein [Gemmatimonadota bacterium]